MPLRVLLQGDCQEQLKSIDSEFIDVCITDPPYGLPVIGGPAWTGNDPPPTAEVWKEVFRVLKPGAHVLSFFGSRTYHRGACEIEKAGFEIRDMIAWLYSSGMPKRVTREGMAASLKPAIEPIVVARKPLSEGSIEKNRQKHGTGGIFMDTLRADNNRYPCNVILDASEEVLEAFPGYVPEKIEGPARFFYCAKAGANERHGHPTVKPLALMRYLVRGFTPLGGIVLDPFCGSGSTLIAAMYEEYGFIGIERDEAYASMAAKRLKEA